MEAVEQNNGPNRRLVDFPKKKCKKIHAKTNLKRGHGAKWLQPNVFLKHVWMNLSRCKGRQGRLYHEWPHSRRRCRTLTLRFKFTFKAFLFSNERTWQRTKNLSRVVGQKSPPCWTEFDPCAWKLVARVGSLCELENCRCRPFLLWKVTCWLTVPSHCGRA